MDLEASNLNLAHPNIMWWPKSACVTLPKVGTGTTVCLHSISWYGARVNMSGIDIPEMIKNFEVIQEWSDPNYVPGSNP